MCSNSQPENACGTCCIYVWSILGRANTVRLGKRSYLREFKQSFSLRRKPIPLGSYVHANVKKIPIAEHRYMFANVKNKGVRWLSYPGFKGKETRY